MCIRVLVGLCVHSFAGCNGLALEAESKEGARKYFALGFSRFFCFATCPQYQLLKHFWLLLHSLVQ